MGIVAMNRGETWRRLIVAALESWRRTGSFEDARRVTMWMGVAAEVAPEVLDGNL